MYLRWFVVSLIEFMMKFVVCLVLYLLRSLCCGLSSRASRVQGYLKLVKYMQSRRGVEARALHVQAEAIQESPSEWCDFSGADV